MAKVSSRIPTLRPKQKPIEVTSKDIGKRVCVINKEGILRYFGEVHFSPGIWCGIEFKTECGKNDGLIDGIRYFVCPPKCGLMVPISKVTLIDENFDTNDDGISGPYSMLFFEKAAKSVIKLLNCEEDISGKNQSKYCNNTTNVFGELPTTTNSNTENKNVHNTTTFAVVNTKNKSDDIILDKHNSSENISVKEEFVNAKRRCTIPVKKSQLSSSNNSPKSRSFEGVSIEKPTSLPQLRSHYLNQTYELNESSHKINSRSEFEESLVRKLQLNLEKNENEEDENKRCSLELDESLGILTPEQMVDGMSFVSVLNSPTSECVGILNDISEDKQESNQTDEKVDVPPELPSPTHIDQSITDYSFGIIDEHLLSNLKTDNSMSHSKFNNFWNIDLKDQCNKDYARIEQTPSPEDLPLDPTPIIVDPKIDSMTTKTSKATTSSFITSITSITSLDTGYQGDGEMSRPASRGADNSPLTRRPLPRPQTRRPDPMTDSDFYTESDADNHEENPLRGDRRAQVIDGTLYGVDPQAAADIYVNNRENMDSSGIFTDIESNTRAEDSHSNTVDVSPSDTSTKTISGNSQSNLQEILEKTLIAREELNQNNNNNNNNNNKISNNNNNNNKKETNITKDIPNSKKRVAPTSPVNSSPSSVRSPRHNSKEEIKKYKIPKREVTSKVKEMLQTNNTYNNEHKPVKKTVGRWDAVMSKISKSEQTKTNLKEVKSKVFNGVGLSSNNPVRQERKTTTRQTMAPKNMNTKTRRVRPKATGSVNSSISDLSASGSSAKTNISSAKKREVVQVTQVLTPSKLSPRPQSQPILNEVKKSASLREVKPKRQLPTHQEKQPHAKECGRAAVKGGRTSPIVRPPVHQRVPTKPQPKVAEALAVLVQHLVFNVEAYKVPVLKKEIQKFKTEVEELKTTCQNLEEILKSERINYEQLLGEERNKFTNEVREIEERYQSQISQLNNEQTEMKLRMTKENEANKTYIAQANEEKLIKLRIEFQKLQKAHEEALDILREENDAIREQIDEKEELIQKAKHESVKLREDYEAKEMKLKQQLNNLYKENQKLKNEVDSMEDKIKERVQEIIETNSKLKEENERLISYNSDGSNGISVQEVQSLRVVLELKQNEISDLRRALAEATQRNDTLTGAEEKAAALNARCEDLQLQLQRKSEYEQYLLSENKRLQDSFKEEINQKKRLTQHNEELQWKLEQNKEVVNKVLEEAEKTVLSRSLLSASFSEKHSSSRHSLERTLSFREKSPHFDYSKKQRSDFSDELSPPTSPKVKGVIEKSDWVSYVLDLDESPDIVASRIVRRSFRNSTLNKSTTPTKSPSNKRPRMKNPLSLSSSASSILTSSHNTDYLRSTSLTNGSCRNNDEQRKQLVTSSPKKFHNNREDGDDFDFDEDDQDVDIELPALPSEIGRRNGDIQALPSPKHLTTEVMISESNSEDESTSSSSVQL